MEAKGMNEIALIHQNINTVIFELKDSCGVDKNNAVALFKLK
jgi:hypothetical protein